MGCKGCRLLFKISRDQLNKKPQTTKVTGVDRNVGHFDTLDGSINVCPSRLDRLYKRVKHYQRGLAKKRLINGTHNRPEITVKYQKVPRLLPKYLKDVGGYNSQHWIVLLTGTGNNINQDLLRYHAKIIVNN